MAPYSYGSFGRNTLARALHFMLLLDTGANMEPKMAQVRAFLEALFAELPKKMTSMGITPLPSRACVIPFGGHPLPPTEWFGIEELQEHLDALSLGDDENPLSPFDAFQMGLNWPIRAGNEVRTVFLLISDAPSFGAGVRHVSAQEVIDAYWDGAKKAGKSCLCGYHRRLFLLVHPHSFFLELAPLLYGVSTFEWDKTFRLDKVDEAYLEKKLNDIVFSLACN